MFREAMSFAFVVTLRAFTTGVTWPCTDTMWPSPSGKRVSVLDGARRNKGTDAEPGPWFQMYAASPVVDSRATSGRSLSEG